MEVTPTEAVLADQNGDFKYVYNLFGFSGYRASNQNRSGLPKNLVGIGGFRNGFVVSAHLNLTT